MVLVGRPWLCTPPVIKPLGLPVPPFQTHYYNELAHQMVLCVTLGQINSKYALCVGIF